MSSDFSLSIPDTIMHMFLEAGWHPDRTVSGPLPVSAMHPAYRLLSQFCGLHVGTCGPGEECATSDVKFMAFDSDPDIADWEILAGTKLVGVAKVHHSHGEMYLADDGRYFHFSDVDGEMCYLAASFGEAMAYLLLGRRVRPMLRPGQQSITIYGEEISREDPHIYHY